MTRYLLGRLLSAPLLLLGVSVLIFLILRLSPGDPAELILAENPDWAGDRQALGALRTELGLDLALPVQYGRWLHQVMRGDLGRSLSSRRPVAQLLAERAPATLALTVAALGLAILVALPLGVVSAVWAGRPVDVLARVLALLGVSMPSFWLGLLLTWTFAVRLGWLPSIGADTPRHLVLPAIALAAGVAATQARLIRASLLEVLGQPFTMVARAKGLSEHLIVLRHALRNALIPSVTALGLSVGSLLGGAAVVETTFAYPGLGKLVVDAIGGRDYPVIQAFVLMMAGIFVGAGLVVDMLYVVLDPRVRLGARGS